MGGLDGGGGRAGLPAAARPSAAVPAGCAELVVVRHGETTWNRDGRLQGHAESPLSEQGRQQASALAARLSAGDLPAAVVYSSDLQRAHDTALAIGSACCLEVQTDAALRERNLGCLQGLTHAEAHGQWPHEWRAFTSMDQPIRGNGESRLQFYSRVKGAVEAIASHNQGKRIIIVSHGGVLNAIHYHATGKGPPGRVVNASINIIRVSNDKLWSILLWGDVCHLSNVGYLQSAFGGDKNSA
eukprot:SM000008S22147  [mRNA]  locus=s8:84100:85827:- [translate_table: standard]